MAIADTISSMYDNVGEVYDTITNVDVNNGKNLFNDTIRQGVTTYDGGVYNYNATRLTSTNWITLRAGTYTINAKTNTSKTLQISNITFDTNDNFYNISGVSGIWKTLPFTFTTPIDIKWKYNFDYSDNSNITINEVNSIQLELGSSATEYQPYTDNPTYKNIENIPSTIRKSYLDIMNNGIDTIYDNWEKVNGTGTSISLNNTEEAPMKTDLKGNTSQETTTGSQLIDFTTLSNSNTTNSFINDTLTVNTSSGTYANAFKDITSTYKSNSSKVLRFDFTSLNSTTDLSGANGYVRLRIVKTDNSVTNVNLVNTDKSISTHTIPSDVSDISSVSLTIYANNTNTAMTNTLTINKPILHFGSTSTYYEPYTNGASPNPDYPQDIHVVSGDNSINVVGKNLFDESVMTARAGCTVANKIITSNSINSWNGFSVNINNIRLEKSTDYYATFKAKLNSGTGTLNYGGNLYNGNTYGTQARVTSSNVLSSEYQEFCWKITTTEENFVGIGMFFQAGSNTTNAVISIKDIIFSKTPNDTYEEYKGASYPINLGVENLLQITNTSQTINGVEFRVNDDKSITINGTASANTNFTLLGNDGTATQVFLLKASTPYYNTTSMRLVYRLVGGGYGAIDSGAITPNSDLSIRHVYLSITSGTTINNQTIYPQIIKGTTAKLYTQYGTNIELCKIGDYQDSIKKSTGKNLFNPATETKNYIVNSEGTLTPNNSYNSSAFIPMQPLTNVVLSTDQTSAILEIVEYDTNQSLINRGVKTNSTFYNLKTSNTTAYIRISYQNTSTKVQFEKGTTALPYEPYGKVWYLNKQIGKVVLNGSENWQEGSNTGRYNLNIDNTVLGSSTNNPVLSDRFQQRFETTNYSIFLSGSTHTISIMYQDIPWGYGNFKTWLSNNNTIVYYALATPTYTEITDSTLISQLDTIKRSYDEQTNITQVNNDLPFILDATALKQLTQ